MKNFVVLRIHDFDLKEVVDGLEFRSQGQGIEAEINR